MNIRLLPFELPFILPPTEILLAETLFLLIVFVFCALIFLKTNSVFKLTDHKGVKYFQSIFLHFGLAYVFRLVHLCVMGLREYGIVAFPPLASQLSLFFVSYFSTMALFSLFMTIFLKFRKIESNIPHILIHAISITFSLYVILTHSLTSLLVFQSVIIVLCILLFPIACYRGHRKKVFSQNSATYILLIGFWILSLLAFSRQFFTFPIKITLYVISASIFVWIYIRVKRRLSLNGKKT